ncbi:MAG: isoaspartyl peptidase/L-asparaginase [Aquificota bacterium]|nr:isoaspartyl peptidase/L-asparaginase [Aquificota bacterium]
MKAIVVHGGAGAWNTEKLREAKEVLEEAVLKGFDLLMSGRTVDACEEAIKVMEDSGVFNAGRGSVRTLDGYVETDASIMVSDGRAGAVGAVRGVKNPISLARIVMERSRHTLIVGEGAERLKPERDNAGGSGAGDTVGCVVTDGEKVVAGTSTGGVRGKERGRVGDAGIIGAGTYASPEGGASATGDGDRIILVSLTFFVVLQMSAGLSPPQACRSGIDLLERRTGGRGGVIALNRRGEVGFAYNTPAMPGAYLRSGSRVFFFGFEVKEEEEEPQKWEKGHEKG